MATYRPIVLVSGIPSELPVGADLSGGAYQLNTITAGSGLSGGGNVGSNIRLDVELAPNASGLYFDGSGRLGDNGTSLASGLASLVVGSTALASGNAALTVGARAVASGDAALVVATAALPRTGGTMSGPITLSGYGPTSPALRANANTGVYVSGFYVGVSSSGIGRLLVGPDYVETEGDSIVIRTSKTPASAGASGVAGQIAWDSGYLYICTATNTWKRADINTW